MAGEESGYDNSTLSKEERNLRRVLHATIKKVTEDIGDRFNFNTAISSIMELVNAMYTAKDQNLAVNPGLVRELVSSLLCLLAPFAPHITEELWSETIGQGSVHKHIWPVFDEDAIKLEEVEIVVQINGKVREKIVVSAALTPKELEEKVLEQEKVQALIHEKQVIKVIAIAGKLVNIVVR
jgi:leucyl-tRNA synthetase